MRIIDIIKKELVGKITEVYLPNDKFCRVKIIDCWYTDIPYEGGQLVLNVENTKTGKISNVYIYSMNEDLEYESE